MPLNTSKGNMYDFITHTWNTVKGKCEHDCFYCYMKKFKNQRACRFDEKELKTDLGSGNFIFVGSSNDLFANSNPVNWIDETLLHCAQFDNDYLFQSKNPARIQEMTNYLPSKSVICTTIETNRFYPEIMNNSPKPLERAMAMNDLSTVMKTFVTIEPIMDFDIAEMLDLIYRCRPTQVNIGADSCGYNLPEPSKIKLLSLIEELKKFTTIHRKTNLARLLK